jgi:hypothetical protein
MDSIMIMIGVLSGVCAFFEYCQHKEHRDQYPDIKPCPSGVFAFVFLALACIIRGLIR